MRVAVLLAAGASRRMGRSKLRLELGGETVLERSVRNLVEAEIDRVRLIVAPDFDPGTLPANVDVVENPNRDDGLAGSLRLGVRDLPPETSMVLIALADKPFVRADTIRTLVERFETSSAPVAYPTYGGEQGHPVLWSRETYHELAALDGDRGAKALLSRYRARALVVPIDDEGVCFDIDTPADYEKARSRF